MNIIDNWYSDPGRPAVLAELLAHPVMAEAVRILVETNLPSRPGITPGADPMVAYALQNAALGGYFNFLRNLRSLAKPKKDSSGKDIPHFGEFQADDAEEQ